MKRVLLLLLLAGCSADRISSVDGKLVVEPSELQWDRVFVGFPLERTLTLRNEGRAALTVQLETEAPFLAPTVVQLAGAEVRRIQVTFAPAEAGDFAGQLQLTASGQGAIFVPLAGHAEVAPDCTSDDPCSSSQLDPEEGCVVTRLPDNSPCGDECTTGAVCKGGQCVGENLNCGGDRCQVCVKGVGCVAIDPLAACPSDAENPCQVPVCESDVGCTTRAQPDGMPCGEASCTAEFYKVCVGGECVSRVPKDGFRCGERSPCQDFGTCQGQECVQGSVVPLKTAFPPIRIPSGVTLHFDGVANDAGTLYWSECSTERCELRAVTRDGFPFFRVEMFRLPGADSLVGAISLVGQTLISTLRPGWVEAYSAETGDRLWSHALAPDLPDDLASAVLTIPGSPAAGDGVVAVAVNASRGILGFDPLGAFLVALQLSNGSPQLVTELEGPVAGVVADGRGSFYLTEDAAGGKLAAVRAGGQVAWTAPASDAPPLSVAQGRVFHPTAGIFDAVTGTRVGELPFHLGTDTEDVLVWSGFAYAYGYPYAESELGPYPQLDRPMLFRVSLDALDRTDWKHPLPRVTVGLRSRPVLTRQGTVLVTSNDKDQLCKGASRLEEWGDGDSVLLSCPLPGAGFAGTALLLDDRYVIVDTCGDEQTREITITSLVLEGYDAPSRGWIAPGGNPGRSQAPRE